ncbi:hypothetical protein GF385_02310 [Candidatus Dependentiae bacterium]|nr:hypothetical protein [Candidatus Dependentiae bacterium]
MRYIKFMLILFTFLELNSQNHTIFLYGKTDIKALKKTKQIKKLYEAIEEILIKEIDSSIEFWPKKTKKRLFKKSFKKKKQKKFCKSKELNKIDITTLCEKLKNKILKKYDETEKQINLIAIGKGVEILKYLLKEFHEMKLDKCISKAIIIDNPKVSRKKSSKYGPRKIINYDEAITKTEEDKRKVHFLESESETDTVYGSNSEIEESSRYEEVDPDEFCPSESNFNIENYVVLINPKKEEKTPDSWCTCSKKEKINTFIGIAGLVVAILAL